MKSLNERLLLRLQESRPCAHTAGFTDLEDGTDRGRCNLCSKVMTQERYVLEKGKAEEHEVVIAFAKDLERKSLRAPRPTSETIAKLIYQTPISQRGVLLAEIGQALSDRNQSFIGSLFANASAMHTFGTTIQEMSGRKPRILDAEIIAPGKD